LDLISPNREKTRKQKALVSLDLSLLQKMHYTHFIIKMHKLI
jgi:hypothetical protein